MTPESIETAADFDLWFRQTLTRALHDRHSAYRWMQLATVDAAGEPAVRTVVLRAVEDGGKLLSFHTDLRSPKVAAMATKPRVSLHFLDRRHGVQLRLAGEATVHRMGDAWQAALERVSDQEANDYRSPSPPGAPLDEADGQERKMALEQTFCLVQIRIRAADLLVLNRDGHVRFSAEFAGPETRLTRLTP